MGRKLKVPILHHLNADSSWLLQLPRPESAGSERTSSHYFNILLDPWLKGPQTDVAWWFSTQWHAEQSAFQSIADVERLASSTEDNDHKEDSVSESQSAEEINDEEASIYECQFDGCASHHLKNCTIDVVAISHEFTDHCHKDTLLELPPSVKVIAPSRAAALIGSWRHFENVYEMPLFTGTQTDWRETCISPLPSWLSIARLIDERDPLYLHAATMISFSSSGGNAAQCVIYTAHGITLETAEPIIEAVPPLKPLCLIHGLHDVALPMMQQINLGALNGLRLYRTLKPKYWFGTHDEDKTAGGLVRHMLRRKVLSVEEAMESEKDAEESNSPLDPIPFAYIANGASRHLS